MSVLEIQNAANSAQQDARIIAAALASRAVEFPADKLAQVHAELAAQLVENAALRARLIKREQAENLIDSVREGAAEIEGQFDDGLVSTFDAIERIDRLKSLGPDRGFAQHQREVWEAAATELRGLLPKDAANGG